MEKRYFFFNLLCWDNGIFTCKKINLDCSLTLYTSINSQWTIVLNIRIKIMKQLEENIKKNFCYFGLGTVCLDMAPKLQLQKKKKWWNSTLISFKMYRISRIRLSHWSTHEAGRNCQNRLFSWNLIKTVKQPGDCLPQKETLNLCSERVVAFLLTCLSFLLPSSEVGAGTVACIFGVFCWRKKG